MFYCFILHVTTYKNVSQVFYTKTFAKMLQNICKTFLHGLAVGSRWL